MDYASPAGLIPRATVGLLCAGKISFWPEYSLPPNTKAPNPPILHPPNIIPIWNKGEALFLEGGSTIGGKGINGGALVWARRPGPGSLRSP